MGCYVNFTKCEKQIQLQPVGIVIDYEFTAARNKISSKTAIAALLLIVLLF